MSVDNRTYWQMKVDAYMKRHREQMFDKEGSLKVAQELYSKDNIADLCVGSGIVCVHNRQYFSTVLLLLLTMRTNRTMEVSEFSLSELIDIRMGSSRFEDYVTLSDITAKIVVVWVSKRGVPNKESGNVMSELLDMQLGACRQTWIFFCGTSTEFRDKHTEAYEYCIENGLSIISVGFDKGSSVNKGVIVQGQVKNAQCSIDPDLAEAKMLGAMGNISSGYSKGDWQSRQNSGNKGYKK